MKDYPPMVMQAEPHISHRRRRPVNRAILRMCGLLVLSLMAGCGQPKGEIFEPLEQSLSWPPAPESARIHYVGQLVLSDDLKPGKSFLESVGESLFGKEDSRSMLTPYALCTDGRDRLFVCDSNAQLVHVFDFESRVYEQWKPDKDGAAFAQPVGIAFDPLQRLLVSDPVARTIFVFESDGTYLGELGAGQLVRPCGLAVDPENSRIFVADTGTHEIVVLAFDGEVMQRIGGRGKKLGQFNYPTNVAMDRAGRLYVSDTLNFRVQVFDTDLSPMMKIGEQGDLPGYFSRPKGLALDGDDHLYVIDANFEAIQIFDPEGTLLLTFGEEGTGPGQFWLPTGIHIDSNDRIWIADSYNRRVQVFDYRPEVQP